MYNKILRSMNAINSVVKFHIQTKNFRITNGIIRRKLVPDDLKEIAKVMTEWSDLEKLSLIISTGGTGLSPRDVTPEATRGVIEKEVAGISTAMLIKSLEITPYAMLSRSVCGIRGQTLIVNLPGSKKASEECLLSVLPALRHAVEVIQNEQSKIAQTHQQLQNLHSCTHHHSYGGHPNAQEIPQLNIDAVARRQRVSPFPAISVSEAQSIVLKEAEQTTSIINVNYTDALGKILSQPIFAKDPLPPFPASIKDGYAVIASDGDGLRQVVGESSAGAQGDSIKLQPGQCIRINTGAPLPFGADAIVPVENTELTKEDQNGKIELEIKILTAPKAGQDIRVIGSDIAAGQQILESHIKLGPSELGLLAAVGVTRVPVFQSPVVAILSSGNELVEPNQPLGSGQIRDSNKTTLLMLLQEEGIPTIDIGIATDDRKSVSEKIKEGFRVANVLITTGGVSMGDKDYMKPILQSDFNAKIHFGRVFMKPGLPTTFATVSSHNGSAKKKLVFGLPGNPVSATVTTHLYVLPALRKMMNNTNPLPTVIKAKLNTDIRLDPRPEFHRALLKWAPDDPLPSVTSTGNQISSRLSSMKAANGLMVLPPSSKEKNQVKAGEMVDVLVIGKL